MRDQRFLGEFELMILLAIIQMENATYGLESYPTYVTAMYRWAASTLRWTGSKLKD